MRIVSLLPGATESLFALGLGSRVVATTHECDWPPEAARLPRVTRSRLALEGLDSGGIETAVAAAAGRGEPLYELDAARIRSLKPDLIVTQDVCQVCATPAGQVDRELEGIPTIRQHPHSLEDVFREMEELADACGVSRAPVDVLRDRIEAVRAQTRTLPRRRAVFLEWLDPPYRAGHWTPDLLEAAGLDDPIAKPGIPSLPVSWERVAEAKPEVLVLAPCGFTEERAWDEAARLGERIEAVGADQVVVLDGSAYFNRPGPRLADSLEILASSVRP